MEIIKFAVLSYKKVHGPYVRSNGRQLVIVVDHNGEKHTISYPKFLVEMFLGKKLAPNETVDHYDGNIDNNSIDNLKVVDRVEHSRQDTRRVKLVKFKCKWCGEEFERSPRLVREKSKKGKAGPFCSRKCAGQYSRQLQLKLIDKLDCQPLVESEYYKQKHVKAFALPNIDDLIDYLCYIID